MILRSVAPFLIFFRDHGMNSELQEGLLGASTKTGASCGGTQLRGRSTLMAKVSGIRRITCAIRCDFLS